MTGKLHILLLENSENEIEFFSDALEESGLCFLLSIARSVQKAFVILNNTSADIVLVNVNLAVEHIDLLKKQKLLYNTPFVLYSNIRIGQVQNVACKNLDYVQLPASVHSMGRILSNLLGNKRLQPSELVAEN